MRLKKKCVFIIYSDAIMEHITGIPREQITLFPEAIEDYISDDNPVRFVDAFVDQLDLRALGFQKVQVADTGRPPYRPSDLLKLYIYGYLNRVRSSRRLERETYRNLEVMWLLKKLTPDHKTISDFRKDNHTAIRSVTRQFVLLCQQLELFAEDIVALDGSKFRAVNSKKRAFTKKKLQKRIQQIDASIDEYLKVLETNDQQEAALPKQDKATLQKNIATLKERMQQYQQLLQTLEQKGETQITLTDPESRLMKHGTATDACYNVQMVVDQKHKLIVEHQVTNETNDRYQLATMAQRAKETLGVEKLEVWADKGYATATELKACEDNGIVPYLPVPDPTEHRKCNIPTPEYYHSKFQYDKEGDLYLCPQRQELTLLYRTWHRHHWTSVYRTPACRQCPVKKHCTVNKHGRRIYRSDHEEVIDRLRERVTQHPEKLEQRKCLSEHPFGTVKHIWGYGHFLLRGLDKVRTEMSLAVLAYNIRRAISVLGVQGLNRQLLATG